MYVYVYVYMYVYIYIYAYMCVYIYIYIYTHTCWFSLLLVRLICWFVYICLFTIRGAAENLQCFARSLLAYISSTWITAAYVMSSEAYHACVHMTRKILPVWEQRERTHIKQCAVCFVHTIIVPFTTFAQPSSSATTSMGIVWYSPYKKSRFHLQHKDKTRTRVYLFTCTAYTHSTAQQYIQLITCTHTHIHRHTQCYMHIRMFIDSCTYSC